MTTKHIDPRAAYRATQWALAGMAAVAGIGGASLLLQAERTPAVYTLAGLMFLAAAVAVGVGVQQAIKFRRTPPVIHGARKAPRRERRAAERQHHK